MSSSTFEKAIKSLINFFFRNGIRKTFRKEPLGKPDRNHPWRLCPTGNHWVVDHPVWVPPTDQRGGYYTDRDGHCRANPGKSDVYTAEELREIAKRNFTALKDDRQAMPFPDSLGFPYGNQYDLLIAGWTKFWNEVLDPKDPLTPDFVKALIATESSFRVPIDQESGDGPARGPIQITEGTREILQNPTGELRDHLIKLNQKESRDPPTNIAAGVRWLHHKKILAEHRLRRKITWEEAGAEYKGILDQVGKNAKADRIMDDLIKFHEPLKKERK